MSNVSSTQISYAYFIVSFHPNKKLWRNSLHDNTLDAIQTLLQHIYSRAVRETHEVMARRVKQVTTTRGVQVEEDTRHHNDLLLQTGLEEVQAVRDGLGQTLEVQPQVEGRVRHVLDDEAHLAQTTDHQVALVAEVALQVHHLVLHEAGLQHGDGGFLEGVGGTSVEVRTTGADGGDVLLGTQNPCDTPSRQAEALGQTVNDEHIILIDILDVLSSGDSRTVAVAGVVVARVELVADKGGARAADVLDLGEFGVGDDAAGRVSRVGGEDDGGSSSDFLGDLVGVDVVSVLLGERYGDGGELDPC